MANIDKRKKNTGYVRSAKRTTRATGYSGDQRRETTRQGMSTGPGEQMRPLTFHS